MKLTTAIATALLGFAMTTTLSASNELPTASFRNGHAEVKEHLSHLDTMAGSLSTKDEAGKKQTADFIVKYLTDHILEHAKWEEKYVYPAVDKRSHADRHRFTSTMRYEHTIIGRSIDALRTAAAKPGFDAARFTRDTDRVLGLISAHFEKEEEVLLPILDATMTREQVEKELGLSEAHH